MATVRMTVVAFALILAPDFTLGNSADTGGKSALEQIKYKYAPIFYLGVIRTRTGSYENAKFAVPLAIDADGDDVADNNEAYIRRVPDVNQLKPRLYSDVLETPTHYYLTYFAHFPAQRGWIQHENDNTMLYIIVDRKKELENPEGNNVIALATSDHNQFNWTSPDGRRLEETMVRLRGNGFDDYSMRLTGKVRRARPLPFEGNHVLLITDFEHHIGFGRLTRNYIHLEVNAAGRRSAYFKDGYGAAEADLVGTYEHIWSLRANERTFQKAPKGSHGKSFNSMREWIDYTKSDPKCVNADSVGLRFRSHDERAPWIMIAKNGGWNSLDIERAGHYTDPASSLVIRRALTLLGVREEDISMDYLYNPYHGIF